MGFASASVIFVLLLRFLGHHRVSQSPCGLSLSRVQCTSTLVPNKDNCLLPPTSPSLARYVDHLHQVQKNENSLHPNCPKAELKVVGFPFSLQDTYCNLGWTLLAADMNGDSEPDLVIGSPFAPGGGKQKGIVAAFYSGSSYRDRGSACLGWGGWIPPLL